MMIFDDFFMSLQSAIIMRLTSKMPAYLFWHFASLVFFFSSLLLFFLSLLFFSLSFGFFIYLTFGVCVLFGLSWILKRVAEVSCDLLLQFKCNINTITNLLCVFCSALFSIYVTLKCLFDDKLRLSLPIQRLN